MLGKKGGSGGAGGSGGKPSLTPSGGSSRGSKGGLSGPSRNSGTRKGSEGRSSKSMIPQNYLNPKETYKGMMSKPNNDGNLWTYRRSWKKPGFHGCFITTAVTRAAGLPDDCYELSVLRMFRREYVAQLEDGERVLLDYREKAPRVIQAIDTLSGEDSQKVWECLYVAGIVPAVLLITSGKWEEAYAIYRQMCEEIEALFLEGQMDGYDPDHWLSLWVEAKLAETPVEALEAASDSGVLPVENIRVRPQGRQASAALPGFRGEASHA